MACDKSTEFLNVDLELYAKSGLGDLIKAFGSSILVMSYEKNSFLSIEAAAQPASVDEAVLFYCQLVESLSSSNRTVWDRCDKRCLNIGIQAGHNPHQKAFHLSKKSVAYLHTLKAEATFTVYACERE